MAGARGEAEVLPHTASGMLIASGRLAELQQPQLLLRCC